VGVRIVEEEISLRELIDVVWNGKILIAITTIAAVLLAFVFSFFISSPVYQSNAVVMVHQPMYETGVASEYINQTVSSDLFVRSAQTHEVLNSVIKNLEMEDELTVNGLRNSLSFSRDEENEELISVIDITLESTHKDDVNNIVAEVISQTEAYMENRLDTRLQELETQYSSLYEKESEELDQAIAYYQELRAGEGLPALMLLEDLDSNTQFIIDGNERYLEELRLLDKDKQVEYREVNADINRLYSSQQSYKNYLTDVQNTLSLNIIRESVRTISEPFSTFEPVSPNKVLNLAIGFVLGLMLGVFAVFFRHYMKETAPKK
jgi:capsular polysaccharide biosynthesis protein